MLGMVTTSDPGTSGVKDIAEALGGGLKENTLVVIEGEAGTGKSVISQHIAYGVLRGRDTRVAYYSTDHNARGLMDQMAEMGLDVDRDVVMDRLRVFRVGTGPVIRDGPKALQGLINHMSGIPEEFQIIFFDSPSWFMTHADPMVKIDFLHICKEFCDQGRTMVLIIDTHVFEARSLARAYAVSDYYLQLRNYDTVLETGQMDLRIVKRLLVSKLGGVSRQGSEEIKFEIKPKVGIQLLPFVKIRV
jgi:flagellar protein FlaH